MIVAPDASPEIDDQIELAVAIEEARGGNPERYIELQWGLVLSPEQVLRDRELPGWLAEQGRRYVILDDFQRDMVWSVMDPTIAHTYVKGNTGCGKGGAAAIAVCTYYGVFPDSKIVLTRDSYRRAKSIIFGEVADWFRRMTFPPVGRVGVDRIAATAESKHEIAVVNPGSEEGFSGAHSPHVMFVFDEATHKILEARYGLAFTQATKFLALANPRTTSGNFRAAFNMADDPDETQTVESAYGPRRLITVGGSDMLNVKAQCLERPIAPAGGIEIDGTEYQHGDTLPPEVFDKRKPIIPGQTCYDTWLGHKANDDPRWVRIYADGKFPDEDPELQIVSGRWVTRANEHWRRMHDIRRRLIEHENTYEDSGATRWLESAFRVTATGLDVGASRGGDPSVLTVGNRYGIQQQHSEKIDDAEKLADWVCDRLRLQHGEHDPRGIPIGVDADGVGWGMGSLLRRRGFRVVEIHGNATPDNTRRYRNKRAEMYGELGRRLDPSGNWRHEPFALPVSKTLREDLIAHEKVYQQDGMRFGVPPKRPTPGENKNAPNRVLSIVERIGRSPDEGDSACYFYVALQVPRANIRNLLDAGFFQ